MPVSAPSSIRSLLRRCLQKDPRQRLRDIADARFQIEEALNEPSTSSAVAALVPARRERLVWAAALVVAAIAAVASTAFYLRRIEETAVLWRRRVKNHLPFMQVTVHQLLAPVKLMRCTYCVPTF
jgi:hypothetical protein